MGFNSAFKGLNIPTPYMESILYVKNYSRGDDGNSGATTEKFSLYSNNKYEECVKKEGSRSGIDFYLRHASYILHYLLLCIILLSYCMTNWKVLQVRS